MFPRWEAQAPLLLEQGPGALLERTAVEYKYAILREDAAGGWDARWEDLGADEDGEELVLLPDPDLGEPGPGRAPDSHPPMAAAAPAGPATAGSPSLGTSWPSARSASARPGPPPRRAGPWAPTGARAWREAARRWAARAPGAPPARCAT
ncbi:unnamed protein product [Prorocentrum cordatum]|uniref:Uncharacterized protein n=1 Tax=Prorocentrum cordatum TaxID=2364126 RepID=A0ABN9VKB6_9DINO|nr:unnamed protein product [Polarella glacialis]